MMKTILRFFLVLLSALSMMSCQLNFDATFHKDKTTSMEVMMKIDDKMLDEINLNHENPDSPEPRKFNGLSTAELPADWTNFYDLKKKSGDPLPKDRDSVRMLRSVMVKFDTDKSGLKGFSMKINRASKEDLNHFAQLFQEMNPGNRAENQSNKKLTMIDVKWDGKKLVIPTGEDPVAKEMNDPKRNTTIAKAKETLNFFNTAFGGANFVITYTFNFEGRIRKIVGKHDLMKQTDKHTVVFKIDMLEIMGAEAEGKTFKKMDEEVIIYVR